MQKKSRNLGCLFILGAFLLLFIWLGIKGWRTYKATQSLLAQQTQIETMMADGISNIDPDTAEALVMDVRRDVKIIKDETAIFMPLTPYLGWLPEVGSLVVAAPHLIEMADGGTEAAAYAIRGLKPALILMQSADTSTESRLPDMLQIIADAQPDITQANGAMERVIAARQELGDVSDLPWRIRTLFEKADPILELGGSSFDLLNALPHLMGSDGVRQYLILAQNEDELRATGGFISGVGLLTVENGKIVDLTFDDAYNVDDWRNKPYDFPPQPLYDYMGLELFLFRDANYWPDFPTSAQKTMDLYSYGLDHPPLDGVIAIDQQFVKMLVEAVGPIDIAGTDVSLNAGNIISSFQQAWALQEGQETAAWFVNRKAFLGIFGAAIQDKLFNDLSNIDPVLLIEKMTEAADGSHLQIYMRDPQVAAVLDDLGWNGRLHNDAGQDVLFAVDTNVGYNKSNFSVERKTQYTVDLASQQANLTLTYFHQGIATDKACTQIQNYRADEVIDYLNFANECYYNFLRVYAPANSQLLSSTTHSAPAEWFVNKTAQQSAAQTIVEQPDLTTFTNFMVLPLSDSLTTNFVYQLPSTISQLQADGTQQYRLVIYNQAGSKPENVTVTVKLPAGSSLVTAVPTPTSITDNQLSFDLSLTEDLVVEVDYR